VPFFCFKVLVENPSSSHITTVLAVPMMLFARNLEEMAAYLLLIHRERDGKNWAIIEVCPTNNWHC
jgi:hypothetical protein